MANAQSFLITISNNITEKEGINYLIQYHVGFFKIDLATKKILLDKLGKDHRFLQSFDLIYIENLKNQTITTQTIEANLEELILVELKTTKKYLPENPKGFFFGATENEFNFAEIMGENFRFCFVSINEKGSSFAMLKLNELNQKIKNKRIQYQINL
jgi:hypothetical protein